MNLLLLLLLAQADARTNTNPDPELERKTFKVAEGFEVNLFAADPLLVNPIQMNFDARGRLWVTTSETYPQVVPGRKPNDKIIVLEDRDGDGRSDSSRVFADGLFIPTGVEIGDGGAYVANTTEILHLKDTDADGKADTRRTVLSGFGSEDTHHIIHGFMWGPDGAFYFNQSIYIHSHVETPHGPRRLGGAGIWRFDPDTMRLDVFTRGMTNPWGHTIDRWGQSFGTDGAGGQGIHYLVPGATLINFPSGERFLNGLNNGHPKYCGHEIISGHHFPGDWRGDIVANDFRANRVVRFKMSEEGSGYAAKLMPDVITSTDRSFRPVCLRMGPDGALYVADWYNPIIQHGEVDFRDPRRDKTHGRIWRITAKGRPLLRRPMFAGAAIPQLLELLKAPEQWTRHFAKRVLAERDPKEVVDALSSWVKTVSDDHDLLEALWTTQTVDAVEPGLLRRLLKAEDGRARAAATRVVGRWHRQLPDALELLEGLVVDDHPRVRLEAVRALKELAVPRAVEVAMRALDKPVDRFLDYALWLTAYELRDAWQPAFAEGRVTFGGNANHAQFALRAVKSPMAIRTMIGRLRAKGWMSQQARDEALQLIISFGSRQDLEALLRNVRRYDPDLQAQVLAAMAKGARPTGDLMVIKRYFGSGREPVRAAAMRLAGSWKLEALRPELAKAAEGGDRAAVDGLAALGGNASRTLFERLSKSGEPRLRPLGVIGLTSIDLKAAAERAAGALAGDPSDLFEAFLKRSGGTEALARALDGKTILTDAARLGLRTLYAAGRQDPELVAVLNRAVGLKPRKNATPEEIKAWAGRVANEGDPERGEAVFRRRELSCLKCHAIGGAGGNVGPDLLSLGAASPMEYIVESILKPAARQKEGFVSLQVLTSDGEILSGVRVRRTDRELVLRDAVRDRIVIPVKSIEREKKLGSVMPEGLADLLTDAEFMDLVAFLSRLGKPGRYAVGNAPVVRRWRVREGKTWVPAYTTVSGELPLEGVAEARAEVEITTPGRFHLRLNRATGLTLSVGGRAVELKEPIEVDLGRGPHWLEFKVDAAARGGAGLRCEIEEAPGSPGRLRIVGGR